MGQAIVIPEITPDSSMNNNDLHILTGQNPDALSAENKEGAVKGNLGTGRVPVCFVGLMYLTW